jgi:hypothetical protein
MAYGSADHSCPSFSDVFAGVETAAWLSGHSVSVADAAAIAIGFQSAFGGSSAPAPGHTAVSVADAMPGHASPAQPDAGRPAVDASHALGLPGSRNNARTAAVVVCRAVSNRRAREVVHALAGAIGLDRCRPSAAPTHIPGLVDLEKTEYRAEVTRRVWRECYRWRRSGLAWLLRGAESFEECRTCLVLTGVNESRTGSIVETIVFTTYSLPFVVGGRWRYNEAQITRYREAAERFAQRLRETLHAESR